MRADHACHLIIHFSKCQLFQNKKFISCVIFCALRSVTNMWNKFEKNAENSLSKTTHSKSWSFRFENSIEMCAHFAHHKFASFVQCLSFSIFFSFVFCCRRFRFNAIRLTAWIIRLSFAAFSFSTPSSLFRSVVRSVPESETVCISSAIDFNQQTHNSHCSDRNFVSSFSARNKTI